MELLNKLFLGNTVRAYLFVLCAFVFALLFKRYLSRHLAAVVYRLIKKLTDNVEKKVFVDLVAAPIQWVIVIMVMVFSISRLEYPASLRFTVYGHDSADFFQRLGAGILILSIIGLVLRLVDFIAIVLERKALQTIDTRDNQLIVFFRDFLKVIIGIIGFLWIIKVCFSQPVGSLFTGLSIVGAALALAAKESLENLIASFIIFFDKPFFTGDLVKVNNISGVVEQIGLRSTRIRTGEKTLVTVPNKQMVDTMLDNFSLRTERQSQTTLELHQQTLISDAEILIDYIKSLFEGYNNIVVNHEVVLKDITKNGMVVSIEFFTTPMEVKDYNEIRQQILINVKKKMESMHIQLAGAALS